MGRKLHLGPVPVRIEADGTFGDTRATTNRLDPEGLDETAEAKFRWIATAGAGSDYTIGRVTVFGKGGLAVADIANSVTDIDFFRDMPPMPDPDDSFRKVSSSAFGARCTPPAPREALRAARLVSSRSDSTGRNTTQILRRSARHGPVQVISQSLGCGGEAGDADALQKYRDQLDKRAYQLNAASVRLTREIQKVWVLDAKKAEADRLRVNAEQHPQSLWIGIGAG